MALFNSKRLVAAAACLLGPFICELHATADESEALRQGQTLYREGLLSTGQPSQAIVQSDVVASGVQFTCVGCHQRSGLGTSEGGRQTPAVTGTALFAPIELRRRELHEPKIIRPAYDVASLKKAIRSGVDPSGKTLDPLMPRYPLSDLDLDNLIAYLGSLTETADPGVTDDTVHFATITTGQVPGEAVAAVHDVVNRYVTGKNALTRHEDRRAEDAPWHKDIHYESFRKWKVHTWTITGDPATWGDQLEKAYEEQPVFAVIGGISNEGWEPVDSFCSKHQLPCILPSTLLVPDKVPDFYNLYYNAGIGLEASVLAKHLASPAGTSDACPILQIHDRSAVSKRAADNLAGDLSSSTIDIETLAVENPSEFAAIDWDDVLADTGACNLVLWLTADNVGNLGALQDYSQLAKIFVSASLVPDSTIHAAVSVRQKLRSIYPYQLQPAKRQNPRLTGWARVNKIELTHKRLQANAFYALNLTADAMLHIRGNYSRDYFLEKIEHMANRMLSLPAYDGLSLAPGQRFLSKGAYVVRLPDETGGQMIPVSEWIVP